MADKPVPQPNPAEAFQKLLERNNNDGVKLASQLFDENFQLREKNREAKDKAPAEGTLVLTADEAKTWKAYQELGIEPKELKKSLDKLPDLEKTNKELAGMESLRGVADIGIDGSKLKLSVLKDQIQTKFPDAVITFKTEKDKDNNEVKVAYIKEKADAAEVSFPDFAAQNLSDYLPALKFEAEQTSVIPGNTPDPKPQGGPATFFDRFRKDAQEMVKSAPKPDIDARFGRKAVEAA